MSHIWEGSAFVNEDDKVDPDEEPFDEHAVEPLESGIPDKGVDGIIANNPVGGPFQALPPSESGLNPRLYLITPLYADTPNSPNGVYQDSIMYGTDC